MGENKKNQNVETTKADQQPIYGSHQQGRHNREETSASEENQSDEKWNDLSMSQQNRMNRHDQGNQEREDDSFDYEMDEEQVDQGRFTMRSQLNEMQDDNIVAQVEGDDKDILGETENARRNQQKTRGPEFNQGNP